MAAAAPGRRARCRTPDRDRKVLHARRSDAQPHLGYLHRLRRVRVDLHVVRGQSFRRLFVQELLDETGRLLAPFAQPVPVGERGCQRPPLVHDLQPPYLSVQPLLRGVRGSVAAARGRGWQALPHDPLPARRAGRYLGSHSRGRTVLLRRCPRRLAAAGEVPHPRAGAGGRGGDPLCRLFGQRLGSCGLGRALLHPSRRRHRTDGRSDRSGYRRDGARRKPLFPDGIRRLLPARSECRSAPHGGRYGRLDRLRRRSEEQRALCRNPPRRAFQRRPLRPSADSGHPPPRASHPTHTLSEDRFARAALDRYSRGGHHPLQPPDERLPALRAGALHGLL